MICQIPTVKILCLGILNKVRQIVNFLHLIEFRKFSTMDLLIVLGLMKFLCLKYIYLYIVFFF